MHLRCSTFPASQGEKVVLRILSSQQLVAFEKLGLEATAQTRLREVVTRPQGFVVTSGPTGAGKTSTLYALMQLIDPREVNVVTLEDPVEVELYGVTQGQVSARTGFTFATGLRAILRQDPDVILVGEMRDSETAGIAMQAALTGHLVLSTLHTSDTVETMVRLVDLGVEPWIVANALSAVLAQRLVRLVCPHCKRPSKLETRRVGRRRDPAHDRRRRGQAGGLRPVHAHGVPRAHGDLRSGGAGRRAARPGEEQGARARLPRHLRHAQDPSLRRAGFDKVVAGLTTVEEVLRVT